MRYIKVQKLDGIPSAYEDVLSELAKKMKGRELLAVVLYFMSDLDDGQCGLRDIEANMRKVHHGKKVRNSGSQNYVNYAASNVRGCLDKETQQVRQGRMKECERLFLRVGEGLWRNSIFGNQLAKVVLEKHGYDIMFSGRQLQEDEKKELERVEEDVRSYRGKERETLTKIRVNQGKFRRLLLERQGVCKICGLNRKDLLIASHIKPWADSAADEKLDPDNGFLLCPNHDALFDKHLISFADDGSMIVSDSLNESQQRSMGIDGGGTIALSRGNLPYLEYHRSFMRAKEILRR